ncbi:MAG TPA: aldo/keto reductase [Vicinamibacteria bacterium]|nr:aldo/keto reductase [Vicinamibacteria bacterium]
MKTRRLGTQGLEVGAVGLGCMGMSDFYGPRNEEESVATIHRALDLGVTMLDSADVYGPHANEELLGRALRGRRTSVIVASKFGIVRGADPLARGVNGRPEYVRASCEASLKRLGIETIDLYYQHRVDPKTPIEETVGAMVELVQAGKVRFLGLSEASPATLRRAHSVHPISALQSEYSLFTREHEAGAFPACRQLGIGLVAYSPLGRGLLTGRLHSPDDLASDDWRHSSPRFQAGLLERNADRARRLGEMAREKGCTAPQLALAWVLAKGDDVVPIPGTKRRKYLEENLGALDVRLSPADVERLDTLFPAGAAEGHRYGAAAAALLDREERP